MASETGTDLSIAKRVRDWARDVRWLPTEEKTARLTDIVGLPPSPDGRQYRYEITARLDDSIDSCPTDDEVREIADTIVEQVESIDHPEWDGPDELHIQVYSAGQDTEKGSCATAHWLADGGYESIETRPYAFGPTESDDTPTTPADAVYELRDYCLEKQREARSNGNHAAAAAYGDVFRKASDIERELY